MQIVETIPTDKLRQQRSGIRRCTETGTNHHRKVRSHGLHRLQPTGRLPTESSKNITPAFRIGEKLWANSLWKVLNFLFCQRCGHPVPGKHAACHTDLFSRHDGKSIAYSGGWHDAGDLSQQTLQTGDVTFSLLEAYNRLKPEILRWQPVCWKKRNGGSSSY